MQQNTRISIRGVLLFLHFRQNIAIQIMLAARSPSTWTLIHPAPEAVLVAKIKQAKPAARNM